MILNFIADLKLTADGQVKILELAESQYAGFTGYQEVHGRDMLEDVVYPELREHISARLYRHDPSVLPLRNLYARLFKNETPGFLASVFGKDFPVIIPPRGIHSTHETFFLAKGAPGINYINGSAMFAMAAHNKVVFEALSQQVKLPLATPTILVTPDEQGLQNLRHEIPAWDRCVIKIPDLSQGQGVIVCSRSELMTYAEILCNPDRLQNHTDPVFDPWKERQAPLFLVQEYIESKPVMVKDVAYEGTMRVALSAQIIDQNARIIFHDAYWKLSSEPRCSDNMQDRCISYSPGKHYDLRLIPDIFGSFRHANTKRHINCFAAVDKKDKEIVAASLRKNLRSFVIAAGNDDTGNFAWHMLKNENPMWQNAALMMIADPWHYMGYKWEAAKYDRIGAFGEIIGGGLDGVEPHIPDLFIRRIHEIYESGANSSFTAYIRHLYTLAKRYNPNQIAMPFLEEVLLPLFPDLKMMLQQKFDFGDGPVEAP